MERYGILKDIYGGGGLDMEKSEMLLVEMFKEWCVKKKVKDTFANYIWWKDNVLNKGR